MFSCCTAIRGIVPFSGKLDISCSHPFCIHSSISDSYSCLRCSLTVYSVTKFFRMGTLPFHRHFTVQHFPSKTASKSWSIMLSLHGSFLIATAPKPNLTPSLLTRISPRFSMTSRPNIRSTPQIILLMAKQFMCTSPPCTTRLQGISLSHLAIRPSTVNISFGCNDFLTRFLLTSVWEYPMSTRPRQALPFRLSWTPTRALPDIREKLLAQKLPQDRFSISLMDKISRCTHPYRMSSTISASVAPFLGLSGFNACSTLDFGFSQ